MSIKSINEPEGPGRTTMVNPQSINEPVTIDDLNPPKITGVQPAGCAIGDEALTLQVSGTGFKSGVVISFDGAPIPTTFVSETALQGPLDPAGFTEPGGHPVTVTAGAYTAQPAVMFTVSDAGKR